MTSTETRAAMIAHHNTYLASVLLASIANLLCGFSVEHAGELQKVFENGAEEMWSRLFDLYDKPAPPMLFLFE